MQESYPHDAYTVDVPCITSDDESLVLELVVRLTDKSTHPRKLNMTQTWLDNHYRPALMKKVEMHVHKFTREQVKAMGNEMMEQIQIIANDLFETITPPQ